MTCAVAAHEFFPKIVEKIIVITPLIGVVLTTLLCASPVSHRGLTLFVPGFGLAHVLSSTETPAFSCFRMSWQIGQVSEVLVSQGAQLILPVAILHAAAFALGYFMSKICKFGETTSRTISIECGMQASLT